GFVFETVVEGFENFGSVCSGGRYDELMGIVGKRDLPATGMGFGPSRLMEVMKEMNLPFGENTATQIFVASAGSDVIEKVSEIAFELRKFGLNVESELIGRKLSKQFEYCDSEEIPWVLVVGSRDLAEEKVTLREMSSGKEEEVKLTNLKTIVEKINGGELNA
ncbi:MAG: ATP phosphoribosyltransferase regulatory subunit, partial [Candidatus Diapherotrites archaeon]|nr:ATP phosphoribosyltransferase regulatory subunit [Candidatus Diapherotrites archaeon]